MIFNPLSANFTKWSNTLTQFVGKLHIINIRSMQESFFKKLFKHVESLIRLNK